MVLVGKAILICFTPPSDVRRTQTNQHIEILISQYLKYSKMSRCFKDENAQKKN